MLPAILSTAYLWKENQNKKRRKRQIQKTSSLVLELGKTQVQISQPTRERGKQKSWPNPKFNILLRQIALLKNTHNMSECHCPLHYIIYIAISFGFQKPILSASERPNFNFFTFKLLHWPIYLFIILNQKKSLQHNLDTYSADYCCSFIS